MVAHAIGDLITGDVAEPEVVVSASPTVGGLLDSLTGSIGISSISSRAKPVAAPVASSTPSSSAVTGAVTSDSHRIGSRPFDKDALRTFISSSMPFGWYFLLWYFSSQISLLSLSPIGNLVDHLALTCFWLVSHVLVDCTYRNTIGFELPQYSFH